MSKSQKQRDRLIELLKELFQLNQPDLDFGFYRIMHAKADKVSSFLENDLLKIVSDAFGEADDAKLDDAKLAIEKAIAQAKDFGAPDPENAPAVIKAKEAYEQIKDAGNGETEIYDHLYRFFERYYDDGDFLSRRYYARETDGKAAAYSIPYDGREVYLHWANRDQYYIKTSEYLTNFTFNLSNAPVLNGLFKAENRKIHCRIIDAAEGEHGNVKTSAANERYFIIDANEPIKFEGNDLIIQFQYRPDADKTGQGNIWQSKRIDEAEKAIFAALEQCDQKELLASLQTKIGENKDRTLLRKYLNQYTSRNTMDYFIHKDLGGFLNRELDFYIKNEIMRLDDIETADAPKVEFFLAKIKILRKIAKSLIAFLAQLEEFQKKIWLKKKFVVETNYCITLDKFADNEEILEAIFDNEAQIAQWVDLFALNEKQMWKDFEKLSWEDFLAKPEYRFLLLDTAYFDENFKEQVLESIENLDGVSGGLLIHSENFQALNLMSQKYEAEIDYVYIDPPYNTSENSFVYKNSYKHSSWASMIANSIQLSMPLFSDNGLISCAIDDLEQPLLSNILDNAFGIEGRLGNLIVEIKPSGRTNDYFFATSHEYNLFYSPNVSNNTINFFELTDEQRSLYSEGDGSDAFKWRDFLRTGGFSTPEERPNSFYPIFFNEHSNTISLEKIDDNYLEILPIDSEGKPRVWRKTPPSFLEHLEKSEIKVERNREGKLKVRIIDRVKDGTRPKSVWINSKYDASSHGTKLLKKIFGDKSHFSFPKSIHSTMDCIYIACQSSECVVLDYFAGSGTTGHATIELNKKDEGARKYILVEMGSYFDTVTKPRIQKVIYSSEWKDGKPTKSDGISHIFKYIRLETYEDALNNLHFKPDENREKALAKNDEFRREYMLKYWLEFETKNSPSLLNISQFANPIEYKLSVKKPSSDEYIQKNVDLIETFNWLIGLWVDHIDIPRTFDANFKREIDPELPKDQETRLLVEGKITEAQNGTYWFRKIEGKICRTPGDKTNMDKVLVIWRKLSGNLEEDNAVLAAWFDKMRINPNDNEFDIIYINGSCTLPNDKIRITEEAFHNKMWDVEN